MTADRWHEVEALFDEVVQQAPAERIAFLYRVCADEQIRAEVVSLLAYEQDGDHLLDSRPWTSAVPNIGTQVNSYRLQNVLGEGGIGIVYSAIDTKLNRPVAVKFLSDTLADSAARQRFRHEARLASSLNHPHILTVHDVGDFNGHQYLVTELVDGGTLNDWIRAEKRTWLQIVELLVGVADGLAAAHEAGILHRDIKPANILVANNGYAKLADFGIAKLSEGGASEPMDTTVGTLAYMSPEQASGQSINACSDIYSFGLVLYELLAGHKALEGTSRTELLETVLRGEIEPLPSQVPVALRRVIEKSLHNQPADRYQSARELVQDLRELIHEPEKIGPRKRHLWKQRAAVGVLLAALLAIVLLVRSRQATGPARLQYTQITNFSDSARAPALSPDGKMVAFIRGGEFFQSRGQIFVKYLPNGKTLQLTDEADLKYAPMFTPDGSHVAYTLLKPGGSWDTWTVPVSGGQPARFLPNASGLTWLTRDKVLYSEIMSGTGTHMGIVSSRENRDDVRTIYFPSHQRAMAHYSYASPDRKWALIVEMDRATAWQRCRLMSLENLESRQVGPEGACIAVAWSPDGKWMYFNVEVAGALHLWRQRFPKGSPEQFTFGPSEEEGIAVSPDGRSLVTSVGVRRSTVWIHGGAGERALPIEGLSFEPRLSPDGKRVFYLFRQDPASLSSQAVAGDRSSPFYQTGELWVIDVATDNWS
ncbi:MAG: protein kinase [Acidobacteriota bacterium]